MKAEYEWTSSMLNVFLNMAKPKSTRVVSNARVRHLLAQLNHKHDFAYCFQNELVAKDLRAYVALNFERDDVPSEPHRTVLPSEVIRVGAQRTTDAMARVRQRKDEEAEQRLAECDGDARKRMDQQSELHSGEAMV